jgi:hypothetical protein
LFTSCCLQAVVYKLLFTSCCLQAVVYKLLFTSCCLQAVVYKLLFTSCCLQAVVYKLLFTSCCLQAVVYKPVLGYNLLLTRCLCLQETKYCLHYTYYKKYLYSILLFYFPAHITQHYMYALREICSIFDGKL